MNVTGVHSAEREQYSEQVERLVSSHALHGSESLCKLLRYLVEHAILQPGIPVKEYQIATEVFHRPADFDPQSDSTIRVQAGRLRVKLAEYYASEGAADPIIVELPKGTYALSMHHRSAASARSLSGTPGQIERETAVPSRRLNAWALAAVALGVLLTLAIAWIFNLTTNLAASRAGAVSQGQAEATPSVFRSFWKPFVSGPEEPWVIFSNGAFVGRPETGIRYFNPAVDSHRVILDHYTGVGEVLAVHNLDRVFGLLHQPIRVKRGSLFTLDDAQNNNLVFVGSPAENLSLRDIPNTRQFVFQRLPGGPRKGDLAIVNVHPRPDESREFLGSPSGAQLTEDYAIVALVRGLNPSRSVMILAGTTTIGTQAAVEYVCQRNSLEQLLMRLSVSPTEDVKPFEALLRVKVARGVPVGTEIVALRTGSQ